MARQSWLANCLLAATTIFLLINVQSSDAAKRYSYYWWDISLLQSEGVSTVNYTGIQKALIDHGAMDVSLIHHARLNFLRSCKLRMANRPWNCSRLKRSPHPYFGKFIDQLLLLEMVMQQFKCGSHYSLFDQDAQPRDIRACTPANFSCCVDLVKNFVRGGELQGRQMSEETYGNWVMVNEHNRVVGITGLLRWGYRMVQSRCYGVSNGCTERVRNEYRTPGPAAVSKPLLRYYDEAALVKIVADPYNRGERKMVYDSWTKPKFAMSVHQAHKPKHTQMVYLKRSPNFCKGKFSPAGRRCDEEGNKKGMPCDRLCCERGHVRRNVLEKYNCQFTYCCVISNCMERYRTRTYCR